MDAKTQVEALLKSSGAVLVRKKKHQVWKFPNGKTLTIAATPSDRRAYANVLRDLAAIGVKPEPRPKRDATKPPVKPNGKRKKAEKPKRTAIVSVDRDCNWDEALKVVASIAKERPVKIVEYPPEPPKPEYVTGLPSSITQEPPTPEPAFVFDKVLFKSVVKLPWWQRAWVKVVGAIANFLDRPVA